MFQYSTEKCMCVKQTYNDGVNLVLPEYLLPYLLLFFVEGLLPVKSLTLTDLSLLSSLHEGDIGFQYELEGSITTTMFPRPYSNMVALVEVYNPTSQKSVLIHNESVDLTKEQSSYWTVAKKSYTATLNHPSNQLYLVESKLTIHVTMCNSEGYCSTRKSATETISKLY